MTAHSASSRGVTLIEVMIAVGITAVIGAMVMGAFQRTYASKELAEAQDERFSSGRMALTRIARELSQAFLSDHYDRKRYREPLTVFRGKDGGERDDLLFATMSHERLAQDAKESDQSVVEYKLDRDPENRDAEALYRREKARIDEDPEDGGHDDLVARDVKRLTFSFWDAAKKEWVREWDTTRVERANELPTLVRVELELALPDGRVERLSTASRVALTRPLPFP